MAEQEFDSGVIVRELEGLPVHHVEAGRKLFEIAVSDISLGAFYLTHQACTLVWDGAINFVRLEEEACEQLPRLIASNSSCYRNFSTKVSLILSSEKLIEYTLPEGYRTKSYRALVERPGRIRFARYDVRDESDDMPLFYSFTAENTQLLDASSGELAVKLPASWPWSYDLVNWIFYHHSERDTLLKDANPEAVAHALSATGGAAASAF